LESFYYQIVKENSLGKKKHLSSYLSMEASLKKYLIKKLQRSKRMALITWTAEQYGTKVDICDDQHKTLFGLLNDLDDLAAGTDRNAIGAKLDALISFVVEHFATEERLMQEKGYSAYPAHKAEHDKLVTTCADLQAKFHAGQAEITKDTTAFVKSWLDSHIPANDMPYAPALNS
jgi:hemerythrin